LFDHEVAAAHRLGYDLASTAVPVHLWCGDQDDRIRRQAEQLAKSIASAGNHEYAGYHDQNPLAYGNMFSWLRG
jgi:hypothetical protein